MATSYTPNSKLAKPAFNDGGWDVTLNSNCDLLDTNSGLKDLLCTLHEVPSTSLNVTVAAGSFKAPTGALVTYAGVSSYAIPMSATSVLYLDITGTIHTATAYPTTSAYVPIATVVTGTTTITSITDNRIMAGAIGLTQAVPSTATASGTYGSTEQTMLQTVYDLVRHMLLGS